MGKKRNKKNRGRNNQGLRQDFFLEQKAPKPRIAVETFTLMQRRQEIVDFILNNPVGVLAVQVPTGGGKTYGLPYIVKNDVLLLLPDTRLVMLEALRVVTQDVRKHLRDDVLEEPVGLRIGRDQGANYHGERFTIGTTGASYQIVRQGKWSIVVLDEFDLDQNGEVAIMHNALYHLLRQAQEKDERLIVLLPSATPDLVNARKFYEEFPFAVIEITARIHDPEVCEVELGSAEASCFGDILPEYARALAQLCSPTGLTGADEQSHRVPVGENVLCTLPSPMYFERVTVELERQLARLGVDRNFIEVVNVWSRSSNWEKKAVFSGGTPGKTTIFLATDLVRRGGTPAIYAAFPSGWQVRNFCDPHTGLEGTREERTSLADYCQDEGRSSRKGRGLVVHSQDNQRPAVAPTFLERNSLEIFLLNLIQHEDIRTFRWWGEVGEERIAAAVKTLKSVDAATEDEGGRLKLTSLGRAMRGIPGSLKMRRMVFKAHELGVLPQFLVITAGLADRGLFANAKNNNEVGEKQKPLINPTSDYLTILNVWNKLVWDFGEKFANAVRGAHGQVDLQKRNAREQARNRKQQIASNQSLQRSDIIRAHKRIDDELNEQLLLIEMGRQEVVTQAVRHVVDYAGKWCFEYGLYKQAVAEWVQQVVNAAHFLHGTHFVWNSHGGQTIELDVMDLLTKTGNPDEFADRVHTVILNGYAEQIRKNIRHRGCHGYFFSKPGSDECLGIFPGSASFGHPKEWLVGVPVPRKGRVYLEQVSVFSDEDLARLLLQAAPQLVVVKDGENPQFDEKTDCVVSESLVLFAGEELGRQKVPTPSHPQAKKVFASWLAQKMAV